MVFRFVLDPAIELMAPSTSAKPGGEIAQAAWGRRRPDSPQSFYNLINRMRKALAADPDNPLELVSTTYYRVRRPGEP
jgi:hypothetical protein